MNEKTKIEVCYIKGQDAFICAVYGKVTIEMKHEIEQDFADNPDEGLDKGDGVYSFEAQWEPPQIGDEGRVELKGYYDLTQTGFVSCEETERWEG